MNSATPLRVLVVDDEAPARRKILRLLRGEPDAQIVAEADSGEQQRRDEVRSEGPEQHERNELRVRNDGDR